ncbi:unnamed protein product [Adineta ricciae]|uniref:Uncharacterized protein n=1 Tax=Adineta ricciae TaxID=249248 RepID=A0A815R3S7_ADIRI|nr:unnamed protein product [Adineta ricciae]
MQQQTIRLSEHIKKKLRQHHITPLSLSSSDLTLSDNSDDDDVFLVTSAQEKTAQRRRSSTFITHQIRSQSKAQSLHSIDSTQSKPSSSLKSAKATCQDCHRRENLLRNEHERLVQICDENRRLNEQLRSAVMANHHYQEENTKLKLHLNKLSTHLREYQVNFNLLNQQLTAQKNNKSILNRNTDAEQLKRLRYELNAYNESVATKQQQDNEYDSYRKWSQRK